MIIHTAVFDDQDGGGNIPDECYNLVLWLLVWYVVWKQVINPNQITHFLTFLLLTLHL